MPVVVAAVVVVAAAVVEAASTIAGRKREAKETEGLVQQKVDNNYISCR